MVDGMRAPTALLTSTAAAVFFVAAGCYAFDDYFDLYVDLANGRTDRPLVTGNRKRSSVALTGSVCFVLALVAAAVAGLAVLAIVAAGSAAALVYNRWLQRAFPIKNLLLAGAFPAPLLLGGLASGQDVTPALGWCAAVAYGAGIGFEVMIDIADVEGDRANGADTLSTRYGPGPAARVAGMAFALATALLLAPFVLPIDPRLTGDSLYLLAASAAAAGGIHLGLSLHSNQTPAHVFVLKRRAFALLLLGLAAFVLGTLG